MRMRSGLARPSNACERDATSFNVVMWAHLVHTHGANTSGTGFPARR